MSDSAPGTGGILLWMAVFVIAGIPFVYLIWEFINHALSGHLVATEAGLAAVGVAGVIVIISLVGRRARRWDDQSGV